MYMQRKDDSIYQNVYKQ